MMNLELISVRSLLPLKKLIKSLSLCYLTRIGVPWNANVHK